MLLVSTKLGISKLHGIGLFAAQFIPKGTITWQFVRDLDKTYREKDLQRMTPPALAQFLKYSYYDNGLSCFVLPFDDQRFINHDSVAPNILSTPRQDVAARDILEGEELTCNYNDYDDTFFDRLGISEDTFLTSSPTSQG